MPQPPRSFLILLIAVSLAACSANLAQPTPGHGNPVEPSFTPVTATPTLAATPSFTPVPPTLTPRVPTATPSLIPTGTPSPTPSIPPFYHTPTFDSAAIVTATRSPNALCPKTDQKLQPTIPDQGDVEAGNYPDSQITLQHAIIEALNRGATLSWSL